MQKKRVDKTLFNFGYKCQNFSHHISRLDYIGWLVPAKALDAVHIACNMQSSWFTYNRPAAQSFTAGATWPYAVQANLGMMSVNNSSLLPTSFATVFPQRVVTKSQEDVPTSTLSQPTNANPRWRQPGGSGRRHIIPRRSSGPWSPPSAQNPIAIYLDIKSRACKPASAPAAGTERLINWLAPTKRCGVCDKVRT